jgi:MFS family permease
MVPLALVLAVRDADGSYGRAGLLGAAYTAGLAASGPLASRIADRSGQTIALVSTTSVAATALVVTALTVDGSLLACAIAVAIAGLATPPLEPCLRTLWPDVVPRDRLHDAFTLEAASQELVFIVGPVMVAVLDLVDPSAPLLGAAAVTAAGALGFAAQAPSRRWRPAAVLPTEVKRRPMSVPALRRLYVAMLFVGAPFGVLTIGLTAFAEHAGNADAGAWLLSAQAAGALLGGLVVTHRPRWRSFPPPVLAAVWAACLVPLVTVPSIPVMMAFAVIAGLPVAALIGGLFAEVERLTPSGSAAEAVGWMVTSLVVGTALATPLTGWIESTSVAAALALGPALLVVAAALLASRRRPSRRSLPF